MRRTLEEKTKAVALRLFRTWPKQDAFIRELNKRKLGFSWESRYPKPWVDHVEVLSDKSVFPVGGILCLPLTGLLKRYILQPFETWLFPPKQRDTAIYKAMFRCIRIPVRSKQHPTKSSDVRRKPRDLFPLLSKL